MRIFMSSCSVRQSRLDRSTNSDISYDEFGNFLTGSPTIRLSSACRSSDFCREKVILNRLQMIVQNPNPSLTSLDKEIFDKATRLINEMTAQSDFTQAQGALNLLLRSSIIEQQRGLKFRKRLESGFQDTKEYGLWRAVNDLETDPRKPKITVLLILGYYATNDPEKTLAFIKRNTEYSELCHKILSELKLY